MTSNREGDTYGRPLAEQRMGVGGLHVKLDKGFEHGVYCVYVEFEDLAAKTGFAPAHRKAKEYVALLKDELGQLPGYTLGKIEDSSRQLRGDGRRRDLEMTFLSFPIETSDRRDHDSTLKEQFRVGCLRTGQALEQEHARAQTQRRHARQGKFREQLDQLLHGKAYASIAPAVKERLLTEVVALAFPSREVGE